MTAAVIFDLDGTLVDSLEDIASAMNHVLEGLGAAPHPLAAYRRFVGEGAGVLVRRALPADRQGEHAAALEAFRARYHAHLLDRTRPYPGVAEALDELVARDLPLAVLSNKPDAMTRDVVARLLERWTFAAVAGERSGVPRKPDPAGAVALARTLGVPPARCLFVGDTRTDMETAVAAGMVPVGVLWGFRDREELVAHGARHLLERPQDLPGLLGS